MRYYNVKDVAQILNVDEETVRRWIRRRDLKATKQSRKSGNVIEEFDLLDFVQKHKPAYQDSLYSYTTKRLSISRKDDAYSKSLNNLLAELLAERKELTERIIRLQTLIEIEEL